AEGDRRRLVILGEPGRAPGRLGGFHDEGRVPALVLVGVDSPEAVPVLLEVEGEGGEGAGSAEPDVAVRAGVEGGAEVLGEVGADAAAGTVGGDDEISGGEELRSALERRGARDLSGARELRSAWDLSGG